jgi:hypothetical protein
MKRLLLTLMLSLCSLAFANPIIYSFLISEIYFDESGNWVIEIWLENNQNFEFYDLRYLESNSGIAEFTHFDTTEYTTITNLNLSNDLIINKDNDWIVLHINTNSKYQNDTVLLGEAEGSYLKNIEYGQSVAKLCAPWHPSFFYFYKTNLPSIGHPNSLEEGTLGYIYGYVYDHTGTPVSNFTFEIVEGYSGVISTDATGYYQTQITSRSYLMDALLTPLDQGYYETTPIDPVSFEINENDTLNINFTQTLTTLEQHRKKSILLSNYPNPATDFTYFVFDADIIGNKAAMLKILDMQGREVDAFLLNESPFLRQTGHLPKGNYMYQLYLDNELLGTNKLILVK